MRRNEIIRLAVLIALVLGITALHYLTTVQKAHFHDIYRRLYYVPIVLGGLWFALRGGLGTAISVSILFAPHVVFQWGHHPTSRPEQYLEIFLYNVIGFLTGFLSQRETEQKLRYQKAAQHLEESYGKLRAQADLILEIEEQLRRADRLAALGELSAGMAHEIRNPLGSIRGTAEILREGIDPADRRHEFAGILIKEVDRLNRVVQDFLDFARPAPVERGRVDINEALRELLVLTRQQTVKSGVRVELLPGDLPKVPGDREQLKQACLNLLLNALQAMPAGGLLTIATTPLDGEVQVRFADTGQGIPPESLEKIFNPFFTTRQEGTGLGLAITHRIVQGHGGRIEVASRIGEGTTFTMVLPVEKR
ncbi:nitrogen regulation protein NR(II) [Desulfuromonas sp. TF]|uniref:two-component system sensor histidine kinase NtrB n=1 Tax=Desulfuromonas sp. TF TaxID=1232410 RepID=UPI0003F915D5|nr:ATP-binding protein [Desulfuromonas sp. TF]